MNDALLLVGHSRKKQLQLPKALPMLQMSIAQYPYMAVPQLLNTMYQTFTILSSYTILTLIPLQKKQLTLNDALFPVGHSSEMIYSNDKARYAALDISTNKKNRVTVRHNSVLTETAAQHSPQFNDSLLQTEKGSKRFYDKTHAVSKNFQAQSFSLETDRDALNDAVKRFETTEDFAEAGYILPDGRMLRFTNNAHKGEREYDHRAIGLVYGKDINLNVHHGFDESATDNLESFVERCTITGG